MGAVVVVVVEPYGKSLQALLVGQVEALIGPLTQRGLDEGFGLPVGLRMSRRCQLVAGADLTQGSLEEAGVGVGISAVGHHPLDVNAKALEVGCRCQQELSGLGAVIRGSGLAESHPRAVIDSNVQVFPTATAAYPRPRAQQGVATPIRNSAELLDVDMQQLARPLSHVADAEPGRAVAISEPGLSMPPKHLVHGRPGHSQLGPDPVRAP